MAGSSFNHPDEPANLRKFWIRGFDGVHTGIQGVVTHFQIFKLSNFQIDFIVISNTQNLYQIIINSKISMYAFKKESQTNFS